MIRHITVSIIRHITKDLTIKSAILSVTAPFIAFALVLVAHLIAGSLGLIPPIFPQIHIVGVM